jgi:hypothetical protein
LAFSSAFCKEVMNGRGGSHPKEKFGKYTHADVCPVTNAMEIFFYFRKICNLWDGRLTIIFVYELQRVESLEGL